MRLTFANALNTVTRGCSGEVSRKAEKKGYFLARRFGALGERSYAHRPMKGESAADITSTGQQEVRPKDWCSVREDSPPKTAKTMFSGKCISRSTQSILAVPSTRRSIDHEAKLAIPAQWDWSGRYDC